MQEQGTELAWHLDKKVPLALICTIAVQTGVFIWWLSEQSARLEMVVQNNTTQDVQIASLKDSANEQEVVGAVAASQMVAVRESLQEIKDVQKEMGELLRRALQNTPVSGGNE